MKPNWTLHLHLIIKRSTLKSRRIKKHITYQADLHSEGRASAPNAVGYMSHHQRPRCLSLLMKWDTWVPHPSRQRHQNFPLPPNPPLIAVTNEDPQRDAPPHPPQPRSPKQCQSHGPRWIELYNEYLEASPKRRHQEKRDNLQHYLRGWRGSWVILGCQVAPVDLLLHRRTYPCFNSLNSPVTSFGNVFVRRYVRKPKL